MNGCDCSWNTYVVDGHDVESLCKAFYEASLVKGRPTCILAKTFKGKGLPGIEDMDNWHGKPLGDKADEYIALIEKQIVNVGPHGFSPSLPTEELSNIPFGNLRLSEAPGYKLGEKVFVLFVLCV